MADEQTIDRMESYTLRIEQYVEAMSSIQRLEQVPVRRKECSCFLLHSELEETAKILAGTLELSVSGPDNGTMELDYGLFLTVAENLIGNAARFAKSKIMICLERKDSFLLLSITDDGPGYPVELIRNSPKPFGKVKYPASDYEVSDLCSVPQMGVQDSVLGSLPAGTGMKEDSGHFGMGLYSSQMLCLKHEGTLTLENRKGYGATAIASFKIHRES